MAYEKKGPKSVAELTTGEVPENARRLIVVQKIYIGDVREWLPTGDFVDVLPGKNWYHSGKVFSDFRSLATAIRKGFLEAYDPENPNHNQALKAGIEELSDSPEPTEADIQKLVAAAPLVRKQEKKADSVIHASGKSDTVGAVQEYDPNEGRPGVPSIKVKGENAPTPSQRLIQENQAKTIHATLEERSLAADKNALERAGADQNGNLSIMPGQDVRQVAKITDPAEPQGMTNIQPLKTDAVGFQSGKTPVQKNGVFQPSKRTPIKPQPKVQ